MLGLLTDRRIRDGQIAAEFRQLLRLGGDSPFRSGDAGIHLRDGPGVSRDILFIRNIENMEIIKIHGPRAEEGRQLETGRRGLRGFPVKRYQLPARTKRSVV